MKSNTIKTLAVIVALTAASIPYQANALNTLNSGIEQTVQDEGRRVTGTVTHIDEESISCYTGSRDRMNALATFNYEILTVATVSGDTLSFIIPQPTEYKVGDDFQERIDFISSFNKISFNYLVRTTSEFDGAIQSGYIKSDGVIKRK